MGAFGASGVTKLYTRGLGKSWLGSKLVTGVSNLCSPKRRQTFMITYRATNTLNGKFYIGSTTDFERRKRQHLNCQKRYPFQNALRKDPDRFEWEVWQDESDEPILEQALLDVFYGTEQCYNLNPIASHPPSPKGKKKSPEHRANIGKAQKGRIKSSEECRKISKAKKGKQPAWVMPDGTIPPEIIRRRAEARVANGKKWTEEQKAKARKSHEKHRLSAEEVIRRVTLIKKSGIDPQKLGSLRKVADLLGLTSTGARHFLNRYWD